MQLEAARTASFIKSNCMVVRHGSSPRGIQGADCVPRGPPHSTLHCCAARGSPNCFTHTRMHVQRQKSKHPLKNTRTASGSPKASGFNTLLLCYLGSAQFDLNHATRFILPQKSKHSSIHGNQAGRRRPSDAAAPYRCAIRGYLLETSYAAETSNHSSRNTREPCQTRENLQMQHSNVMPLGVLKLLCS